MFCNLEICYNMDFELRSLVYDVSSCSLKGMTLSIRLDSFLFFIFQKWLCIPDTCWCEDMLENQVDFQLSGSSKQRHSKRFLMHTHAKRNRCRQGKNRQKEKTIVSHSPHSFQTSLWSYLMEYYVPTAFSPRLNGNITMIPITFCSDLQAWRHFFNLKQKMH